ncbi:MAG: hypothetical protein KH330_16900 [Clostridiales bacterium]|nr:hypothetical protein [Clostridiales bacterium]
MSYKKAAHVLPEELLRKVQEYVDGEFIYIPRASDNKKGWGETSLWLSRCNQEKKGKAQSRRNRRLCQEMFVE